MIEIDEETVDKAIEDILGTDESVRGEETPSAGGAQVEKAEKSRKSYTNRCRTCGTFFETPNKYGQCCPACKRKRISEGQKARQAREHGAAPANDRQIRSGSAEQPKEAAEAEKDPVERAWAAMDEAAEATGRAVKAVSEAERNAAAPEREPEPTTGTMTADRENGAWGVLSALYSATRDVARVVGADPQDVIEALYRMNSAMDYMEQRRRQQ